MGNKLSSDTWLRASDEVTNGLPGTYKLVDDILIGAPDYKQLAVRLEALLVRCDAADMTLSSNKVQVGERVTFAGYVVDGATVYADPAKVEAISRYPEPTKLKELRGWFGLTNQMQNYVPGLAGKQKKLRSLLNKGVTFWIDEEMREELEKTKQAISDNILLNHFCMKRATVVITDASGDGFAFILLQYTGSGYIVIQVGSAAIKKVWKSYLPLKLGGTCVIWSLESLKFYLKGMARFELWTDHSPLKDAMLKPLRDLSPRLQKFREAVEGYGMVLKHVRGATNLAADSMSRAPVGSPEDVEKVLNGMKSQGNRYVYNRIVSSVQGDISNEVLENPALDDMWEAAEADEEYKLAAKVIADKVKMKEVMKMDKHPIKQFRRWAYRLSLIKNKNGTRLMLLDATRLVVPEALQGEAHRPGTCGSPGDKQDVYGCGQTIKPP